MLVEVTHLVAAMLRDPVDGVNAQLQTLPRLDGHDEPPAVDIVSDIDDDASARNAPDADFPKLLVTAEGSSDIDAGAYNGQDVGARECVVRIAYLQSTANAAEGVRAMQYTDRAVRRCLMQLSAPTYAAQWRANGVCIDGITRFQHERVELKLGNAFIEITLLAYLSVRETL
jgi:hypothetical protein